MQDGCTRRRCGCRMDAREEEADAEGWAVKLNPLHRDVKESEDNDHFRHRRSIVVCRPYPPLSPAVPAAAPGARSRARARPNGSTESRGIYAASMRVCRFILSCQ